MRVGAAVFPDGGVLAPQRSAKQGERGGVQEVAHESTVDGGLGGWATVRGACVIEMK